MNTSRSSRLETGSPHVDFRSGCPIASALELLGDRWTPVILRDLAKGKSRFTDVLHSPERIATNILTARLAQMEADGLVTARLYQRGPKRYADTLTRVGAELMPVLQALALWGQANLPDRWIAPLHEAQAARPAELTLHPLARAAPQRSGELLIPTPAQSATMRPLASRRGGSTAGSGDADTPGRRGMAERGAFVVAHTRGDRCGRGGHRARKRDRRQP